MRERDLSSLRNEDRDKRGDRKGTKYIDLIHLCKKKGIIIINYRRSQ